MKKVLQYPSKSSCVKRFPHFPKGTHLIVLSAALIGITMVLTKGALEHLPPLTLISIQTASSVSFFWIIVFLQGIQVPLNWNTLKAAAVGLLEPGLSYIFGIFGLSLTTASNSTFITTMEPVMTMALAWLILRERISSLMIVLGLLACVGVALIASPGVSSIHQGSSWGNLLLLLSVLFAALYAIATQKWSKYLAPVLLAAVQQSAALILLLVMMTGALFLRLEVIEFSIATGCSFMIAVVSGVFGYGLAFLLYLSALRYQPASRISLYLTLVPVFGVLSAFMLLGERLAPSQGFGGALILLVVIGISQLPQQKSR